MGITASLGFLLTQGERIVSCRRRPDSFAVDVARDGAGIRSLQGLFGSRNTAPLRGGFGLSVHFAWDNGTSLSGGYVQGRGDGIAPSAIYIGGPDYHIGRGDCGSVLFPTSDSQSRDGSVPWPWLWEKLKQEWSEAELANEVHIGVARTG